MPSSGFNRKPPFGTPINWSHPRTAGLIGAWDMQDLGGLVARDATGRYGNGTLNNAPKFKNLQGGHVLDFVAASSQSVTIADNPTYALNGAASRTRATFATWFRMNSLRNYNAITTKQAGSANNNLFDSYVDSGGTLHVGIQGNDYTSSSLVANKWYHLVIAFDDGDAVSVLPNWKIYLNGALQSSTNSVTANTPTTNPIRIGTRGDAVTLLDGQVASFRLWSRALQRAEVLGEYNSPWEIYDQFRATPAFNVITDFAQSVIVAASVTTAATEAMAAALSAAVPVTAGASAALVFDIPESVSIAVQMDVAGSKGVPDFPQSVTIATAVTAEASEEMAAAPSVSVPVSATAVASLEGDSAHSVTVAVQLEAAAAEVKDIAESVSVDVSAGASGSGTASAAATVAVSVGSTAAQATNAPKAVTVAVSAGLTAEESQRLLPTSIQSGESFGTPNVAGPMNPGTIASGESFGTPRVNVQQSIAPGTITSGESFGAPTLSHVTTMRPGGIASAESFGTPTASQGNRPMLPGSIASGESFGAPTLSGGKNTLQAFVGNYDRSRWLKRGSTRLQSQTLGRWSGSIEFFNIPNGDLSALDTADEWTPQHGQTILIKEFGRALMRGCIKELTATRALSTNLVTYTCQIADKTAICDRRVIRVAYPDVSQGLKQWDVADVIRDIHANYLDGEGIVLDPALPASLGDLTTPLSPFIKVTQAYDTLRDITGLQWFIDLNQVLRFTDTEEAEEAPFEITETSKNWRNLSVKISDADYRNRQYVVSNRKILPTASGAGGSSRVESYTLLDFGTGHTPIFPDHTGYQQEAFGRGMELGYIVLQFGIGSITGIKVNGVSKHVYQEEQLTEANLFGVDDWWAYFTSQTVDFVFPHFFLQAGDVVEITYVPATNTAAANTDPVLVVEQPFEPAPGELFGTCGSGRYDAVEQVNDVGTQEGLDAVAAGLLERSGVIPKIATVETDVPGAQIGQRLHVDVLRQLCDDLDMFITGLVGQSVDGEDLGQGSSFRWTVTATNFPDVGNWKKTWERLWRRTQHPQPIDRTVAATVILAPGAALRNNSTFNTPRKVDETGLLSEIVCRFDTPPVDQDLVIDIKVDGASILTSARLVVPAGFTGDVVLTEFARANLYLFKDQTITGLCTYRVTGANPVSARNGTISIRTTA